jgi:hypothetical protein
MNTYRRIAVCLMVGALQLAYAGVAGAWVPWTNANGSATNFNWQDGGSDFGLFGNPTLVGGDTFLFTPGNYRAQSQNGAGAVTVGDRLEVDILAHAGFDITGVRIQEIGDYAIFGGNGDGEQVAVSGSLILSDLERLRFASDTLVSTPVSPITSGSGIWTADASLDLSAAFPAWKQFTLIFDNDLVAITNDLGEVAWIQKKAVGVGVAVTIIPEPVSLCLLGLGGLVLAGRRKAF